MVIVEPEAERALETSTVAGGSASVKRCMIPRRGAIRCFVTRARINTSSRSSAVSGSNCVSGGTVRYAMERSAGVGGGLQHGGGASTTKDEAGRYRGTTP